MPAYNLKGKKITKNIDSKNIERSLKEVNERDFHSIMTRIINTPSVYETVKKLSKE